MPDTGIKKQTYTAYIVKLLVGLFFIFVFGRVCPPWGGITQTGIQAIGIFFGLIFLLSNSEFGLILPSLLGFLAVLLTDAYTPSSLMAATFGNSTVVQIIFAYVLCQTIISTGAGEFISKWLLTRKVLRGKPYLFCFVFFFAAWVMGAFAKIGGIVFVLALLDSLIDNLGYEKEGSFNRWMSLGSFVSACIGMALIPFQGLPLVIFGAILSAMAQSGIVLNYAVYMLSIIVFSMAFIVLFALTMKACRVDADKLRAFDVSRISGEQGGKLRMTRKQVLACLIFLFAIAYSVVMAFLPADSPLGQALSTFDQCTWFILALVIFFLLREDGKPLLNEEQTFRSSISWGIVLAVCIFNVIGGMLANPELGVRGWLNALMEPIFTGLPFPVFMLLICFVSTICTNVFANAAVGLIVGTLTMPFAITYGDTIGINVTVYGAAVTMSAMFSFMTMASAGYVPLFLTRPCIQKNQKFLWGVGGGTCLGGILLMTVLFTALAYLL
ncbi:hypothetical protein NE547_00450 [Flavonifractor sp. DFI.6.63]|uniref:Uncharacterized protein n=1 Tax=Lawsonibacter hominis TaxID=2763053 RepID=A0A8J6JH96_9FIRM|nr:MULTISPECIES: hypothetical protein [Oscillospiraceae]MBC5734594.1 hypothetical protein [Lawsonibacter hominis]MCI6400068.1 hypothetical protein [Lawsonibacter sp.]MCQ5028006.1 hypothetical protein [Flavonifractor sp. DFI.6.63]MDY2977767.1 hypothetical protein [Oscillospiraceae bacterium]